MEKQRGDRRDRSWHYSQRTYLIHQRVLHNPGPSACRCGRSIWSFRKAKAVGCRCLARKHGVPKVPGGICSRGDGYRSTVRERISGRRLMRAWQEATGHSDAHDVDL